MLGLRLGSYTHKVRDDNAGFILGCDYCGHMLSFHGPKNNLVGSDAAEASAGAFIHVTTAVPTRSASIGTEKDGVDPLDQSAKRVHCVASIPKPPHELVTDSRH
jgi:hypothetical protein